MPRVPAQHFGVKPRGFGEISRLMRLQRTIQESVVQTRLRLYKSIHYRARTAASEKAGYENRKAKSKIAAIPSARKMSAATIRMSFKGSF